MRYYFESGAIDLGLSQQERMIQEVAQSVYDEKSLQILMEQFENWEGTYHPFGGITESHKMRQEFLLRAMRDRESPAAVMKEMKPVVQAKLDDLLGQN